MIICKYSKFLENNDNRISRYDIQDMVLNLHHNEEDFEDGDILDRISKYEYYELKEVDIDDIDIDEFYIGWYRVDDYIEKYKENNNYPPVVLNSDLSIIDGTHRLNALDELGIKKVRAYVGID